MLLQALAPSFAFLLAVAELDVLGLTLDTELDVLSSMHLATVMLIDTPYPMHVRVLPHTLVTL